MKTLKTALSLLLTLCLLLSFGVSAFAVDNDGYIEDQNETIGTNNGYIDENYGSVAENAVFKSDAVSVGPGLTDTVDGGMINVNCAGGVVEVNNGLIGDKGLVFYSGNHGLVETNGETGQIITNGDGGVVEENNGTIGCDLEENAKLVPYGSAGNYGTVRVNGEKGSIMFNQSGGVVEENNGMIGYYIKDLINGTTQLDGNTGNYGTVTTNNGKIMTNQAGGTVEENNGTIGVEDYGSYGNYGTVKTNGENGKITNNQAGSVVEVNNGYIFQTYSGNDGKDASIVTVNNGTIGMVIGTNASGNIQIAGGNGGNVGENNGEIAWSKGTIRDNFGVVDVNSTDGIIINNSGTVKENNGTVENNFGSPDQVAGNKPQNQFTRNVTITTENATADKTSITGNLTAYGGKFWMNDDVDGGGSITVNSNPDYTIKQVEMDESVGTAEQVEGGWKLTFNKLLSSISLFIRGERNPKPQAKSVASLDNWSDGYALFCKAVVKQIKNAEQNGTVTVDGTGWASFMRMVFEALAERPDVTLVVKYGTNKELTISPGTDILALIGTAQDVLFTKLAKLV